jgi:hypothetical protein
MSIINDNIILKLKELAAMGLTASAVAKELGVARDTIKSWSKKYNIILTTKKDLDFQSYNEILVLLKQDKRVNEIRALGYCHSLIHRVADENNIVLIDRTAAALDRILTHQQVIDHLPKDQKYQYLGYENKKYKILAGNGIVFYKSACHLWQGQPSSHIGTPLSKDEFFDKLNKAGYKLIEGSYEKRNDIAIVECLKGQHRRKLTNLRCVIYNKYNGCDLCNDNPSESKEELELLSFIKTLYPEAHKSHTSNRMGNAKKGPMPEIDVYVPSKKIGFEYCGVYWHSRRENVEEIDENNDQIEKDDKNGKRTNIKFRKKLKREAAEKEKIRLFHIYSSEWKYKNDLIKGMIKAKMGLFDVKIHARKCVIKTILQKESHEFLKDNHIMGEKFASKNLGMFYNDQLVSVLTYSTAEEQKSINEKLEVDGLEIDRFCSKIGHSISGALSKFLSYLIREHNPHFIKSFVDLRHGDGHSLLTLGFQLLDIDLGFSWSDGQITYNRHYCKANMDDRKLKESEHADEMGLFKIYDAGQAKFIKWLW